MKIVNEERRGTSRVFPFYCLPRQIDQRYHGGLGIRAFYQMSLATKQTPQETMFCIVGCLLQHFHSF